MSERLYLTFLMSVIALGCAVIWWVVGHAFFAFLAGYAAGAVTIMLIGEAA